MGFTEWLVNRQRNNRAKEKAKHLRWAINDHVQACLYRPDGKLLSGHTEEFKQYLINSLEQMIQEIFSAKYPVLEFRKIFSSLSLELATYNVIAFSEEEKETTEDLVKVPYISGKLHYKLPELSEHFDELNRIRFENNILDADLRDFCYAQGRKLTFYCNGLNYLRCDLGDIFESRDWVRPLLVANMIWRENYFRSCLNMEHQGLNRVLGATYCKFGEYVFLGAENPFYEFVRFWDETTKDFGLYGQPHYLPE